MFSKAHSNLVLIKAIDVLPKNVTYSEKDLEYLRLAKLQETGNLMYLLGSKVGAKIMLTRNSDLGDRFINEQAGKVMAFRGNDLQITKFTLDFMIKRHV